MHPHSNGKAPIACTLNGGDYQARLAWIAELNARSLRSQRREGLRLELTYAPDAAGSVREMVGKEEECCAFLVFDLQETNDRMVLRITAPESADDIADELFRPFLASAGVAAACACGGEA